MVPPLATGGLRRCKKGGDICDRLGRARGHCRGEVLEDVRHALVNLEAHRARGRGVHRMHERQARLAAAAAPTGRSRGGAVARGALYMLMSTARGEKLASNAASTRPRVELVSGSAMTRKSDCASSAAAV